MKCPRCMNEVSPSVKFCTKCGFGIQAHLESLQSVKQPKRQQAEKVAVIEGQSHGTRGVIADAITYPFRGTGIYMVFGWVLFMLVAGFATRIPILGLLISIIIGGYGALYYFKVIQTSSTGKPEPPDFPDFNDVWELISACFVMFVMNLFTFLPMIIYIITLTWNGQERNILVIFLLLAWGGLYFPMASIIAAETRNVIPLNPVTVMIMVSRASGKYYLFCLLVWLLEAPIFLLYMFSDQLSELLNLGFFMGTIMLRVVDEFLLIVSMLMVGRLLGTLLKELCPEKA